MEEEADKLLKEMEDPPRLKNGVLVDFGFWEARSLTMRAMNPSDSLECEFAG